jgi:tetratricopeptide (TPR) repeat protein
MGSTTITANKQLSMIESAKSNLLDDLTKLRRSPHAMASWQNALQCLNNGRHAPALATFNNLVQQFPGVPQLWAELGIAATGNLDFAAADQAFQRALELASADPALLVAIGAQYYHLRRLDQALACFERAVAANPSSVNLRLTLAAWLERFRRLDEALECVETCLTQHPKDDSVRYFKAFLLHRKGLNAEAETLLRDLLKSNSPPPLSVQADAHHLLGVVLDAFGQYTEALSCIGKAKTLRSQTVNMAAHEMTSGKINQARRELLAELTPATLQRWREEAGHAPLPASIGAVGWRDAQRHDAH